MRPTSGGVNSSSGASRSVTDDHRLEPDDESAPGPAPRSRPALGISTACTPALTTWKERRTLKAAAELNCGEAEPSGDGWPAPRPVAPLV